MQTRAYPGLWSRPVPPQSASQVACFEHRKVSLLFQVMLLPCAARFDAVYASLFLRGSCGLWREGADGSQGISTLTSAVEHESERRTPPPMASALLVLAGGARSQGLLVVDSSHDALVQ